VVAAAGAPNPAGAPKGDAAGCPNVDVPAPNAAVDAPKAGAAWPKGAGAVAAPNTPGVGAAPNVEAPKVDVLAGAPNGLPKVEVGCCGVVGWPNIPPVGAPNAGAGVDGAPKAGV